MEKELNYPIKYAVKEIRTRCSIDNCYSYLTQGFIVSKCYVVESVVRYNSDGSNSIIHKVVFPYSEFDNFMIVLKFNVPYYEVPSRPGYNSSYSASYVDTLYDDYETANIEVFLENEKLKRELVKKVALSDSDWKEKLLKLQNDLTISLENCKKYERYILENTRDMVSNRDTLVIDDKKNIEKKFLQSRMVDVLNDAVLEEKISRKYDAINIKVRKIDSK